VDPNECLRLIIECAEDILRRDASLGDRPQAHDPTGVQLANLITGLDSWLSKGGFPPRRWTAGRPPA